jgi:hypothetical protein
MNAKKQVSDTTTSNTAADAPANAEDVATAADLIPATGIPPGKEITSRFIDPFATPKMQQKLQSIQGDVSSFSGCDVPDALKLANEGAMLLGTYQRLQNSTGRVRQRLVQINKRLNVYRGSFVQAQRAAAPGSAVAKGLAGLAGLRNTELTAQKAKRTKKKNKAKKKAKTASTSTTTSS